MKRQRISVLLLFFLDVHSLLTVTSWSVLDKNAFNIYLMWSVVHLPFTYEEKEGYCSLNDMQVKTEIWNFDALTIKSPQGTRLEIQSEAITQSRDEHVSSSQQCANSGSTTQAQF